MQLRKDFDLQVGDSLLAASFVSYIGPFGSKFREKLWSKQWLSLIRSKDIPMSEGIDPLRTLSTAAMQARWQNEGLPADRISLENASIITNCARWPLIIDPQLQGNIWIRGKVGEELITMQTSQHNWTRTMETALTMGQTVLLENLGEDLDATLDPILSRAIYKKGKNL